MKTVIDDNNEEILRLRARIVELETELSVLRTPSPIRKSNVGRQNRHLTLVWSAT